MFSDARGPVAEHLPAAEVADVLDALFSHFNVLAERYRLERIKTIGDCYMRAAGVRARAEACRSR